MLRNRAANGSSEQLSKQKNLNLVKKFSESIVRARFRRKHSTLASVLHNRMPSKQVSSESFQISAEATIPFDVDISVYIKHVGPFLAFCNLYSLESWKLSSRIAVHIQCLEDRASLCKLCGDAE